MCRGSRTTFFFFFNDPATTEIYTLSLHDALPISPVPERVAPAPQPISIETRRAPEKTEATIEAAASATSAAISGDLAPAPRVFAVQRKAERVSMTGTNAYAVLGDLGARRARVLDLGF